MIRQAVNANPETLISDPVIYIKPRPLNPQPYTRNCVGLSLLQQAVNVRHDLLGPSPRNSPQVCHAFSNLNHFGFD